MKITAIEDIQVDGGWDTWSYLKISSDEGVIGWAEYSEERGRRGTTAVLRDLAPRLLGWDPMQAGRIAATLRRDAGGWVPGLNALAIGAIENALLDLQGKVMGIPARELLGGTLRDRIPVYWSHCGLYRSNHPELFDRPVRSLEDVRALGAEVAAGGFRALKTNLMNIGQSRVAGRPMTIGGSDAFAKNIEMERLSNATELLSAFHDGAGEQVRIMLDVNFNYKPEGFRQLAHLLEPLRLQWLEADTFSPTALSALRASTSTPIASLETALGRRQLLPFLEVGAVDVALIDVVYNGAMESVRMASLCDTYEVNVAAHNSSSPLGTLINASVCAVIPNFRMLEYDVDAVPWRDDLFNAPVHIDSGELILPDAPGWGIVPDEDAMRAHAAAR